MPDYSDAEFEWDIAKSAQTLKERGFDFAFAVRIFDFDCIEAYDSDHDDVEVRTKCTGYIGGTFFTLVYTERPPRKRIISALRALKYEIDDNAKEFGA